MKQFIKNNFLTIISFMIIFGTISYYAVSYIINFNEELASYHKNVEACNSDTMISWSQLNCVDLLEMSDDIDKGRGFYEINEYVLRLSSFKLIFITFLLITLPVIYNVCRKFKNKELLYELTREEYGTFKKKMLIDSYKNALIIPMIFLVFIIFFLIYTKGLLYNKCFLNYVDYNFFFQVRSPYLYIITYLVRAFLISIIYVNIALIVSRKRHNIYISVLISHLAFISTEILLQGLVGRIIFEKLMDIKGICEHFSILNVYNFPLGKGYIALHIPLIVITILSFVILHLKYRSKEKLIIDCEKNN